MRICVYEFLKQNKCSHAGSSTCYCVYAVSSPVTTAPTSPTRLAWYLLKRAQSYVSRKAKPMIASIGCRSKAKRTFLRGRCQTTASIQQLVPYRSSSFSTGERLDTLSIAHRIHVLYVHLVAEPGHVRFGTTRMYFEVRAAFCYNSESFIYFRYVYCRSPMARISAVPGQSCLFAYLRLALAIQEG